MTAKEFLAIKTRSEDIIGFLEVWVEQCRESVVIPPLEELRPATAADIVEGAIIYKPEDEFWLIVQTVRYPDDDFKAFVADDGCRYGLHKAFVAREGQKTTGSSKEEGPGG